MFQHLHEVGAELGTGNELLERSYAGIRVSLAWLPIMDVCVLTVAVGDEQMAHTVPHSEALEAFHHPFCYLAPAQVSRLLPSPATIAHAELVGMGPDAGTELTPC